MLKLNSILIGSENPKRLAKFYGAMLQAKPGWEGDDFTGYKTGDSYLMVGPHDKVHGKSSNPERLLFNFETNNVEGEFERIKKLDGAKVVMAPYNPDPNSGVQLATIADPDGNYFQLASPMG